MTKFEDSSQFTRRLSTTQLDCGQTLRELSSYHDIALWWFAHFDFIDSLLGLPDNNTDYKPKQLKFQARISKLPASFLAGLNFCFDLARKMFIKTVLAFYGRNKLKPDRSAPKILFTAEDLMWRSVRDYETRQIRKSDAFFDSLTQALRRSGSFYLVSTYPFVKYAYPLGEAVQSTRILVDKLRNWDVPHRPPNLYWTAGIWKAEYKASRYFRKAWKALADDKKFRQLCVLNGRDIFDFASRKIRFYFLVLFPYALKRIEMSKRMLDIERPDLVLLINEYGVFERALLVAGKSNHIPTVAIQHGNITPSHQGYMYAPDEISESADIKFPHCPIPDKTAVFGPYFKHLLTAVSSYPESRVVVTGPPRYDALDTLQKRCTRKSILSSYGLDDEKKIVLWTTQCIGLSDEENIRNFRAVRAAVDQLKETVIIIKQHPREGGRYTRMITRHLDLPRQDVLLVPKTADTLSLIRACDAMITKFSTTAIEAIALDKPLIIMNLGEDPDKVEFVNQQVALGVYQDKDLAPAIQKMVNADADMAEHRKEYIEQYLYRIDGQAAQRVVNLIKRTIETGPGNEK